MTYGLDDEEYLNIVLPIVYNKEFAVMKKIQHHNKTRFKHVEKVSYYSYKIAKKLKLDYASVARGGMLHDFYLGNVSDCQTVKDKVLLYTTRHPKEAVMAASKIVDLSDKEKDIIKSHMFPIDYRIPKYAESWIVNIVDTTLSCGELFNKFSQKMSYFLNLFIILMVNIIK